MSTISSPGLGSGLDVSSIVTQLVALERKPIENLQTQASAIQTKLSSFGLLQSYATNLRDIADKLAKPDFWTTTAATSSDSTSVAVTTAAGATPDSYQVEVSKLAKVQMLASKAYTAATTVVGTGTLSIQLGSWDTGLTAFTADVAKPAVNIVIGAEDNTLEKIKAKINAANAGVTASIVNDATGYRLSIRSNAPGATQAVKITATDADGVNTDAAGLSALAFDPPTAAGQMTQSQAARNAEATINGLAIVSASNTLSNVIDGVTLTLAKETTSAVNVGVALDTTAQKKAIADFAKAYSDMNAYIVSQTKYDAATKKAAVLQGDRPTLTLQSTLRGVFTDNSSASSAFTRLSDIGLQLQVDGSLKVNDTKLAAALANPTELAKVFSSTVGSNAEEHGFAVRVKALANSLIGTDGPINSRTKTLRASITRNAEQQAALEKRVAMTEARLTRQYAALDTTIARIKATNSSLAQSLAALAAQSEGIAKNS